MKFLPCSGALLSYGFRPFFLAAGAYAALAMLIWLPLMFGKLKLPIAIPPRDWHIHEMIYGYATAAIAGFLLTAIPNWTGRAPVRGRLLAVLILAWLAGRFAMAISSLIGDLPAALIDMVFLTLVAAVAACEIVRAGNRRNFVILGMLALLIVGNALYHIELLHFRSAGYGQRLGLASVVGLIVLIGGRIIPAFTRNALLLQGPGRLPSPFGDFDIVAVTFAMLALAAWTIAPSGVGTGVLAMLASLLQAARLLRWAGDRCRGNWLILALHLAFAFIPLGFLVLGIVNLADAAMPSAAEHAWGVGAVGLMTLSVMSRATLGHTGRQLRASTSTIIVYLLVIAAALARIGAAFPSGFDIALLHVAAIAWISAFVGFAIVYGPMMLGPHLDTGPSDG